MSLSPLIRRFSTTLSGRSLLSSLSKIGVVDENGLIKTDSLKGSTKKKESKNNNGQPLKRGIIDGPYLNNHFKSRSALQLVPKVPKNDLTRINGFFNDSRIDLDWSIYEYNKIPGEQQRLELEEQSMLEADIEQESSETVSKYEQEDNIVDELGFKPGGLKYLQNQQAKKEKEDLINNLPEVIMLGRCNVGKSSLINALISNNKQSVTKYARVKQTAGYTPCLNFYNVGGLFRLVDSPGYGEKGKDWQGELVFQYLLSRRVLKNSYLILDGKIGLNQYDELILDNLVQCGVQFDIIFNKIDKLDEYSRISHLERLIKNSVLNDLKIQPRYYFVNSVEDAKHGLTNRSGVNELRYALVESTGLELTSLKAKLRKKKENETERNIKRKNLMKAEKALQKKSGR